MNIWFKIAAGIAIVLTLTLIILAGKFLPSGNKSPQQPEKTFYDIAKEDDARLRAAPTVKETTKSVSPTAGQTAQSVNPTEQKPATQQTVAETQLKFRELPEEEEVEAQKLFEMALASRKMGRLPVLTYGQTVDYCRQIIQRFPGSEWEFKAKRILADIPEQYRRQYKITSEEINLGNLK
jgi:type IV secretory pathway VirB10-like protein